MRRGSALFRQKNLSASFGITLAIGLAAFIMTMGT
jgi:hypothetical protein